MRVFIACPAGIATGGTELLHQLCSHLTRMGIESYMVYTDREGFVSPMPERFEKYKTVYVSHYLDAKDSVLVLSEGWVHLNKWCKQGKAVIWWLSVDNFCGMYLLQTQGRDLFKLSERKDLIHLVQSRYAADFLENCFGITKFMYLSDYINDEIIQFAKQSAACAERKNICLYNPKKGFENLAPVIRQCRKDIQWISLKDFSPVEMAAMMCISKVYIDFGAHPGKDRIPREAAVCGCNIITNKKGSAANSQDVAIDAAYKIEDMQDIGAVLSCVYDLVDNYKIRNADYEEYRNKILNEKDTFIMEVEKVAAFLQQEVAFNDASVNEKESRQQDTQILDSVDEMLDYVKGLLSEAKVQKKESGRQAFVQSLLKADSCLQLVKEAVYTELEQ